MQVARYDIVLVKLNPTVGSEIRKTRPCVVVSPDEFSTLHTVIVAPMTSKGFDFSFRPKISFMKKEGRILLDQIRAIDKKRIIKRLGHLDEEKAKELSELLVEMFRY